MIKNNKIKKNNYNLMCMIIYLRYLLGNKNKRKE